VFAILAAPIQLVNRSLSQFDRSDALKCISYALSTLALRNIFSMESSNTVTAITIGVENLSVFIAKGLTNTPPTKAFMPLLSCIKIFTIYKLSQNFTKSPSFVNALALHFFGREIGQLMKQLSLILDKQTIYQLRNPPKADKTKQKQTTLLQPEVGLDIILTSGIVTSLSIPYLFSGLDRSKITAFVIITCLVESLLFSRVSHDCDTSCYEEKEYITALHAVHRIANDCISLTIPYLIYSISLHFFKNTSSYFNVLSVINFSTTISYLAVNSFSLGTSYFNITLNKKPHHAD
jgi:hypothetical protein